MKTPLTYYVPTMLLLALASSILLASQAQDDQDQHQTTLRGEIPSKGMLSGRISAQELNGKEHHNKQMLDDEAWENINSWEAGTWTRKAIQSSETFDYKTNKQQLDAEVPVKTSLDTYGQIMDAKGRIWHYFPFVQRSKEDNQMKLVALSHRKLEPTKRTIKHVRTHILTVDEIFDSRSGISLGKVSFDTVSELEPLTDGLLKRITNSTLINSDGKKVSTSKTSQIWERTKSFNPNENSSKQLQSSLERFKRNHHMN
ncbi:MAG: hypothetical protein K2X81_25135 [Candidatus Obscuribacterales bacterium]|nr:hypothetical protein [Candidatus Obscuribacterales bacterium]